MKEAPKCEYLVSNMEPQLVDSYQAPAQYIARIIGSSNAKSLLSPIRHSRIAPPTASAFPDRRQANPCQ